MSNGAIDRKNPTLIKGICIKCCACVKRCPVQAKVFEETQFIFHKIDLENTLKIQKEPSLFLNENFGE